MIIIKRKIELLDKIETQLIESVYLDDNESLVYLKIPLSFYQRKEISKIKKIKFSFVKKEFYIKNDFTRTNSLKSSDFYSAKSEAILSNSESLLKFKSAYRDANNENIFKFSSTLTLDDVDLDIIEFTNAYVFYVPIKNIPQDLTHFKVSLLDKNENLVSYKDPVSFYDNREISFYIENASQEDFLENLRRNLIISLRGVNINYVTEESNQIENTLGLKDFHFQFHINQINVTEYESINIGIKYKDLYDSVNFTNQELNYFNLNQIDDEIERKIAEDSILGIDIEELLITFDFTVKNHNSDLISITFDKNLPSNVIEKISSIYRNTMLTDINDVLNIDLKNIKDEDLYSYYSFSFEGEELEKVIIKEILFNDQKLNKLSTALNQTEVERTSYIEKDAKVINNLSFILNNNKRKNIFTIKYEILGKLFTKQFLINSTIKQNYTGTYINKLLNFHKLAKANFEYKYQDNLYADKVDSLLNFSSSIKSIDSFSELAKNFGYIDENNKSQTDIFLKNTIIGISVNTLFNNKLIYSKEEFCTINNVYDFLENKRGNKNEFVSNEEFKIKFSNNTNSLAKAFENKSNKKQLIKKIKTIEESFRLEDVNLGRKIEILNEEDNIKYEYYVYYMPLSKNIFSALGKGIDINYNIASNVPNYRETNKEFDEMIYSAIPSISRTKFNNLKESLFKKSNKEIKYYNELVKEITSICINNEKLKIGSFLINKNKIIENFNNKSKEDVYTSSTIVKNKPKINDRPDFENESLNLEIAETDIDVTYNDGYVNFNNTKGTKKIGLSYFKINITDLIEQSALKDEKEISVKSTICKIHPICKRTIKNNNKFLEEGILNKKLVINNDICYYTDSFYKNNFNNFYFNDTVIKEGKQLFLVLSAKESFKNNINVLKYINDLNSAGFSELLGFSFSFLINFKIENSFITNKVEELLIKKSANFNLKVKNTAAIKGINYNLLLNKFSTESLNSSLFNKTNKENNAFSNKEKLKAKLIDKEKMSQRISNINKSFK